MSSILTISQFLFSIKFWFSLIIILILHYLIKSWLLRKRMPPGPVPLPFLGNMFTFRNAKVGTHEIFYELSKTYGDPLTIYFGNTPSVIINDYDLAKELFQKSTFSGRQQSPIIELIFDGSQDLGFTQYNPLWTFHRKIFSKGLREIINSEKFEYTVLRTVDFTLEHMLREPEKVDANLHMRHIDYNLMASLAFGRNYKPDDVEFLKLCDLVDRGNKEFLGIEMFNFPFSNYLPLKRLPIVKKALTLFKEFNDIRNREIEEHRKTYIKGQIRDFTDAMLNEQAMLKEEGPEQAKQLTDEHVSWLLFDFFNGDIITTPYALQWFILFMILHPKVQEECYQNIVEVIGNRKPKVSDRAKLPFVEACFMETMRLRPAAQMGVPHASTCDTKIGAYFIPENTQIFANNYAMQIDPKYWKKPLEFNPRLHFINEVGQLRTTGLAYAPFGFGKRICPAEQVAKNEAFLIVVRLLQQVRFEPIDGVSYNLDYDLTQALSLVPLPFHFRVSKR